MRHASVLGGLLACTTAIGLAVAGEVVCHDKQASSASNSAGSKFERLKELVGDWEVADEHDKAQKGKIAARYHLTAGGSAVVETVFPNEDMEMVTVYHRDGDQLMLTHYCHLGNQPRMRTKGAQDGGDIVFEFVDGANIDAAKDTHMHSARIHFVDSDHFSTDWELYREGKSDQKHKLDLVRKK